MMQRFLISLMLMLLTACSTFRDVPSSAAPLQGQVADQPFDVGGRLAVNYQGKGHVASFDWQHTPSSDELAIKSPVGTTLAAISRSAGGVAMRADGRDYFAPNVEALTEAQLGWPLPLSNLVWWVRGHPAPSLPYQLTLDGDLQQQDWLIRISRDADNPQQPRRVELTRQGLNIRLVLSDWRQFTPLQPVPSPSLP